MTEQVKPLFKYIGGKTWLKNHLRQELVHVLESNTIKAYCEPFAGGLGAFLSVYDLLLNYKIKDVILNDINSKLICLYKEVKTNPTELLNEYIKLEESFKEKVPTYFFSLDPKKDKEEIKKTLEYAENYYKRIRESFNINTASVASSAKLLFLQKHCFNGIYRENASGGYNTPFNWDGKSFSKELMEEKILSIKSVLDKFNITFINKSFEEINYNKQTFYYLDPPYINQDLVENKYNKEMFDLEKQKSLIEKIHKVPFIYSNHSNDILLEEFSKYNLDLFIRNIPRKNLISASGSSRKNHKMELLITNIGV